MRTDKIVYSLRVCLGTPICENCDYRNKGCFHQLMEDAALRLEELCSQIKEDEKIIEKDKAKVKTLFSLSHFRRN